MANNKEKSRMPDLKKQLQDLITGKPQVIIIGADKAEIYDLPSFGKYEINTHNNEITTHHCIESHKW
ncbi:hypothetical protein DFP93_103176 [Aneurinibacillus soli]|uniref:Uncharacterized protein n=1 Tax=Aneurinibacillus soli TaxID=1500254 RepID=A0A0U5B3P5_9BACL|nr:hypothetical protein [Aneurinibacillus soli]PYE62965.1 hypothetical protein DFP93_103176 [Aneurinibacillus soli]BAU28976.1 hypothetical protein CB4_03154 [Aneurinibacillus soli]